jgi:hypothetical protein
MDEEVIALRRVLIDLIQDVSQAASGRSIVIGDRKRENSESLLSIGCEEISSSLVPALFEFCEEHHARDVGGLDALE